MTELCPGKQKYVLFHEVLFRNMAVTVGYRSITVHIISMADLLCEGSIAHSPHVTMVFPQGHISSAGKLCIIPQNLLQQLWTVNRH